MRGGNCIAWRRGDPLLLGYGSTNCPPTALPLPCAVWQRWPEGARRARALLLQLVQSASSLPPTACVPSHPAPSAGGQKARVALARCCYSRASVQLLDDPLSAVDPRVARVLFDQAISGLMQVGGPRGCPALGVGLTVTRGYATKLGGHGTTVVTGFFSYSEQFSKTFCEMSQRGASLVLIAKVP